MLDRIPRDWSVIFPFRHSLFFLLGIHKTRRRWNYHNSGEAVVTILLHLSSSSGVSIRRILPSLFLCSFFLRSPYLPPSYYTEKRSCYVASRSFPEIRRHGPSSSSILRVLSDFSGHCVFSSFHFVKKRPQAPPNTIDIPMNVGRRRRSHIVVTVCRNPVSQVGGKETQGLQQLLRTSRN